MDPKHRGSEEQDSGGITRAIPLIAGDHLLTVNPVDGSEVEPCPPGRHPGAPRRRAPESRVERERAAAAPIPTGVTAPDLPLLERTAERERLVKLLRRGRSVRLTGPRGSGRSALLDAVAAECAGLAPDGVVRLSGCQRTPSDLMQELFAAVYDAPGHRPGQTELEEALRGIGAVVLLDDLEFGGRGLDSLLDATPECAFLITAAPGTPAPSADAPLEEVELTGIGRSACRELMEHVVRRPLTEDEAQWAADLWFESEGLPLRFVQAGALLRQRTGPDGGAEGAAAGAGEPPTLAEGAAPAALLAAGLSATGREVLRFAVALGGVLPHPAHLPALLDDARADTCLGELLGCGLVTAAGTHHRLAPGVTEQLAEAGYDEGAGDRARTAARHYAWWTGHPSVTPERVAQEAEAVIAAVQGARRGGHASAAVLLARTAAPMLAASLYWSAWERVLRGGQEAARTAGEVAEEAYFHHDLGVLALCTGNLDRARAELEASIGLRGVLADRRGTVAGRRALALVEDRATASPDGAPAPAPAGRAEADGGAPGGTGGRGSVGAEGEAGGTAGNGDGPPGGEAPTRPTPFVRSPGGWDGTGGPDGADSAGGGGRVRRLALPVLRRNVLAAGGGALLAALVGTVVALGMASGGEDPAGGVNPSVTSREDDGITVDRPAPSDGAEEEQQRPGRSGAPAQQGPGTPSAGGTRSAAPGASGTPGGTQDAPVGRTPDGGPQETEGEAPSRPDSPADTERPPQDPTGPADEPESPPVTEPTDPPQEPTQPTDPEPSGGGESPTGGDEGTVTGSATPGGSRSLAGSGAAAEPPRGSAGSTSAV
ncbi:ATP-binding protein [Streptomyces sp. URMC 125]|uniref:ATP-binding protein n=1 Tax=Streptomyces sp. URMC 125 TaxID=3423419 RepID=UPI003F1CDDCC